MVVSSFNLIHLSTSSNGGAAKAALSLHRSLINEGVPSKFLYLTGEDLSKIPNTKRMTRTFGEIILSKIVTKLSISFSKNSFFSPLSVSISALEAELKYVNPQKTILHFHNWFNISNLRNISDLAKRGFNVVLTLHDERNYTGGCHYAFNCERFVYSCNECPNVRFGKNLINSSHQRGIKIDFIDNNINFIAPSKWIMSRFQSSRMLSKANVKFIPNAIRGPSNVDVKNHGAINPFETRNTKIGIASMNPFDPIKGGNLVRELLHNQDQLNIELIFLKDFEEHEDFWREIDFLCVPSIIDNSPNVIHEAKLRGKLILATKVGGISEMFSKYDVALKAIDYRSFVSALEEIRAIYKNVNAWEIRVDFENYLGDPIASHIEYYRDIINPQKAADSYNVEEMSDFED
jgi:hypothetical protein